MANSEKRNSTARITPRPDPAQGVGGRQQDLPLPSEGGGYLDICTILRLPVGRARADSRVDELADMGLSPTWRRVAEAVGFDTFLVVWQILDDVAANDQRWNHKDNIRLNMPSFRRFLRYQRNLYIQQLDSEGHSAQQIQGMLCRQIGVKLSVEHIGRVAKRGRNE